MCSIPDKELDYHYSPSRWSHRMSHDEVVEFHIKTCTAATREAQWCLDVELGIKYGDSEQQKLDVYTAKNSKGNKGGPIFAYFHGGYWQEKEVIVDCSGHMAQPLVAAGATVISIDYDLCPDVTLETILSQAQEAIYFIFKLAKERHSRQLAWVQIWIVHSFAVAVALLFAVGWAFLINGIYLGGHSAGAHIVSMMLKTPFQDLDPFDSELIKGAVLVSGVYDLRPLVKTSINDPLHLTEESAWELSSAKFIEDIAQQSSHRDILIAVGEYDSPEFHRQSGELEKSLRDHKVRTRYMDIPDTDHFSVLEKLSQNSFSLTKECLRLMDLPKKK